MEDIIIGFLISIGLIGIIIIAIVWIASTKTTTTTTVTAPTTPSSNRLKKKKWSFWRIFWKGLLILSVIGIIILGIIFIPSKSKIKKEKKYDNIIPKNPNNSVVISAIKNRQPIDIPTEGLNIYLYKGWKDHPNGPVNIVTPNGETIPDKPSPMKQIGSKPEGWYVIYSDPVGSERQITFWY